MPSGRHTPVEVRQVITDVLSCALFVEAQQRPSSGSRLDSSRPAFVAVVIIVTGGGSILGHFCCRCSSCSLVHCIRCLRRIKLWGVPHGLLDRLIDFHPQLCRTGLGLALFWFIFLYLRM